MTAREGVGASLAGFIADLPTPFNPGGQVDWAALELLCERQIAAGATALVAAETAGEAATLTLAEHRAIIGAVVRQARGRIAVVAGASSNSTSHAIELSRQAEAAGADGLIAVVPYYNKPMQSGIDDHFRGIAGATGLPIILHDVPSRTARALSDETVVRLAASPQFIGLKDCTCDFGRPLRLKPLARHGFRLLSGDDTSALGYLAQGGDGCISMVANVVPAVCRQLYLAWQQNLVREASGAADLAALSAALAEDGAPALLKYALSCLGLMSPAVRLPLVEPSETAKAAMRRMLQTLRCVDIFQANGATAAWESRGPITRARGLSQPAPF